MSTIVSSHLGTKRHTVLHPICGTYILRPSVGNRKLGTGIVLNPVMLGFFFYTHVTFLFKKVIYLFLERGEGREKERERNINV